MALTVVTTSPGFGTAGQLPQLIGKSGWNFIRCADTSEPDGGVSAHAAEMEYLVVGLVPATAETIASAPKLKAILKHGVGVDNIDIPAATARGIPVLNTPGANANAVAELALGGMFSLARRIPMVHRILTDGGWQRHVGTELDGKTLGVVGLGNIGRILARKARALGMRVLAADLYPDEAFMREHDIRLADLDTILRECDYVSLHIFGGKDNARLIGPDQLALMKPTACLMNYARGEIVDLDALAEALAADRLGGAAIDAYTVEPPDRSHPVFKSDKIVFTPHSGADTKESVIRMGMMVVEDIAMLEAGGRPARTLNKEVYK